MAYLFPQIFICGHPFRKNCVIFKYMNITVLRFICVLQFGLAGYMALSSFVYIFNAPGWHSAFSFTAFCLVIYLCAFVLQVLYKNYPDTPLSMSQKSVFNWIFVLNFFMLSALLTYNINDFKVMFSYSQQQGVVLGTLFYTLLALHLVITIFQLYILFGMVKLRRKLNENFEKKSSDLDILH